jgi:hypothetical protein
MPLTHQQKLLSRRLEIIRDFCLLLDYLFFSSGFSLSVRLTRIHILAPDMTLLNLSFNFYKIFYDTFSNVSP